MQTPGGTGTAEREPWNTLEELCDRYLGGRPSEPVLQLLKTAEQQRPEVRDFVERAFRLMALSKFDPRDISPAIARFFVVFAPSILPGAWGGIVRPSPFQVGIRKSNSFDGCRMRVPSANYLQVPKEQSGASLHVVVN